MSVSLYKYTPACDGEQCPGDCDLCGKAQLSKEDATFEEKTQQNRVPLEKPLDYISREALLDIIDGYPTDTLSYASARKCIREMLTADVVEVVRCKDCIHFLTPHGCGHIDGMVTAIDDGFCSYGERRTDG